MVEKIFTTAFSTPAATGKPVPPTALVAVVIWAAAGNRARQQLRSAKVRIPAVGRMCIPAKLNKPGACAIKIGVAATWWLDD